MGKERYALRPTTVTGMTMRKNVLRGVEAQTTQVGIHAYDCVNSQNPMSKKVLGSRGKLNYHCSPGVKGHQTASIGLCS